MESMNGSLVNFTTPEASTYLTSYAHPPIMIMVLGFHFTFGLFIHSYVIWLIIRGTLNGLASEFFNLNLFVFEDVLSLNSLFTLLTMRFPNLATISYFLMGLAVTGRPLFQCLMCVERYLAVVHPVTFLKFKPLRYRVICSTAAWIITLASCLFSTFILVSLGELVYTGFYTLLFVLFLFIQLFFLVAVLRALKKSEPGERGREKDEENPIKIRAFYLIVLNTVCLFIIYVPIIIAGFQRILTEGNIPGLIMSSHVCFILVGFVQPFLFLHRSGKLPVKILKIQCC